MNMLENEIFFASNLSNKLFMQLCLKKPINSFRKLTEHTSVWQVTQKGLTEVIRTFKENVSSKVDVISVIRPIQKAHSFDHF